MSSCENCANAYDEGYQVGHNAENARLRARMDWLLDDFLIERFGCGFDLLASAAVPNWFFDELAQRWAQRDGVPVDEYRKALTMEGWTVYDDE